MVNEFDHGDLHEGIPHLTGDRNLMPKPKKSETLKGWQQTGHSRDCQFPTSTLGKIRAAEASAKLRRMKKAVVSDFKR
jgi:hypothetical protein